MLKTLLLAAPLFALLIPAPALADPAVAARNFKAKCAACHGPDGKGKTKQGEKMKIGDMTSAAFKKDLTKDKVKNTILDGITREKDGVKQEMKGLRGKLAEDQVDELVTYVLELK
jgi:mono/diheme cytochrome c family protein